MNNPYDVVIIGGGINGAGIARDAAGAGLSVLLCEKGDLAGATSSASTKLIHGGLRYLEHYEFRLVREALKEREMLLRQAPHIIAPMQFVLPHEYTLRPAWLVRMGLFIYDHLGERKMLPASKGVRLERHVAGALLKPEFTSGFIYADCWVDDARLVALNAMDAKHRGATIVTRTECVSAKREGGCWKVILLGKEGEDQTVEARALVNATGPWAASLLGGVIAVEKKHTLRLVKGSHIVVKRQFPHPFAYIFQNNDKRVVFAIPYEGEYTLIGTTDVEYNGDPGKVAISEEEILYLCNAVNHYFSKGIIPADVVWSFAGVRPLVDGTADDAQAVSRDYLLEVERGGKEAPLLNVFGGKITTYRTLAVKAMEILSPLLGVAYKSWTEKESLPGGNLPGLSREVYRKELREHYPWLPEKLAERYTRSYGTLVKRILGAATAMEGLGLELAPGLYEAEVRYLKEHEFALTAEDILWRRTKLGLQAEPKDVERLEKWL